MDFLTFSDRTRLRDSKFLRHMVRDDGEGDSGQREANCVGKERGKRGVSIRRACVEGNVWNERSGFQLGDEML